MSILRSRKNIFFDLKIPVVICIFKRFESTKKVLEAVKHYAPDQIFVIADGPRNKDEAVKCSKTRSLFNDVGWPCKVYRNFSEEKLGGKARVSSGISWVFKHVDKAIILEDDCMPSQDFFAFCAELLTKYAEEPRVMQIAGSNFQYGRRRTKYSYYFSNYPLCWGWATWRRAWKNFDIDIKAWPKAREKDLIKKVLNHNRAERYWTKLFQNIYDGRVKHGWDYRWTLACWLQGGLTITPEKNLVANIGNTNDAAHMQHKSSHLIDLSVDSLEFPLKHNPIIEKESKADAFTFDAYYSSPLLWRLSRKLKKMMGLDLKNPW
ncbi:MAG: glycosyltransferase family 2 protein [Cyanobacteria bacterium J06554_1]